MKKTISLLAAAALLMSMLPAVSAESTGSYIEAPYALAEGDAMPTEYLAPVFYENENGPTISVIFDGVIVEDGLYFKDSDNDRELDVFEDWRLDTETRAADLVSKLTEAQRIGLLANSLMCNPLAQNTSDAYAEDGSVNLSSLVSIPDPNAEAEDTEGMTVMQLYYKMLQSGYDVTNVTENYTRSGIIRKDTSAEVGALFNNALNMAAEYAAVTAGEVNVPYMLISNPMNTGYPDTEGMAAAVIGDGNYDLIREYAELDAAIWDAKGIHQMYGPQIDLITDPRWSRNSTTYTEVPEVMAGIAEALVVGYQHGTDGAQTGDVALIMKHFPGDSAVQNGFESHYGIGQLRLYSTEGSLENYHLVGFQAAVDAGVAGIMTSYSRDTKDARSATQYYRGVEITPEELGSAYSSTILQTLLKDTMGFTGFVNSDSNIITSQNWGVQDLTLAERYALAYNTGCDVVCDGMMGIDYASITEAVTSGLVTEEAFLRATTNRMINWIDMGMFENPYRDPAASAAVEADLSDDITALKAEANLKSVVLLKNHESVLPLTDTAKTVFVASYTSAGEDEATVASWNAAFEAAGFTLAGSADEADVLFLVVSPTAVAQGLSYMSVLELGEFDAEEYDTATGEKTGSTVSVTTLDGVKQLQKSADAVHANGGIVVSTLYITNPWILTNLEPYCDALIGNFASSVEAQMAIITGAAAPTGKLPVTMPSCSEVLAVNDTEIDGVVYEVCVSPNDVPGYDKDAYIDPAVLAQSPSGSYAYMDADGNVYVSCFGLTY